MCLIHHKAIRFADFAWLWRQVIQRADLARSAQSRAVDYTDNGLAHFTYHIKTPNIINRFFVGLENVDIPFKINTL